VTDVRRHMIYNWTTYPGLLAALAFSVTGSWLLSVNAVEEKTLEVLGWLPWWQSGMGLLACGLVMLVCFVMFRIGGGDVKLMAMVGAFLGPYDGITAMLWTFVLGACVALIVMIWRVGALRVIGRLCQQLLWLVRLRQWSPLSDEERALLQPPLFLAPNAFAAIVLVRFGLLDFLV
jgi:prepilin peptidase CpaA